MMAVGAKPAEAAFPGANDKIAFASNRTTGEGVNNPTGDYEIFAMKNDRTGIEQLTFNTADDFYPAWSDDGGWIAWTNYEDDDGEIYMRSYSGGGGFFIVRRLTNNTADDRKPVFAPDGSNTIAFDSFRDGNSEIYVMNTSDTNPADGNADTQTNLTNNAAGDDTEPAWSPLLADGTAKIAFRTDRDSNNHEIYVMDTDGTNQTHLTNNTVADDEPDWSPDGSKIAFSSNRNDSHDIYVMDAKDEINNVTGNPGPDGNGDNLKRLTKKAAGDYEPAWSPDGKKIAFKSNRGGGDSEIYVMKAKREGKKNRPKNLTNNDDVSDFWPDWRPIPQP
jgi:Tol biopolymer transport system component